MVLFLFVAFVSCLIFVPKSSRPSLPCNLTIGFNDFNSQAISPMYSWILNSSYFYGIITSNYFPNESSIQSLVDNDLQIIVQIYANPDGHSRKNQPPIDQVMSFWISTLTKMNSISSLSWLAFIEDDSCGTGFPYDLLLSETQSYSEAYSLWLNWLEEGKEIIDTYRVNNGYPMEIYAQSGFAVSSHSYLRYCTLHFHVYGPQSYVRSTKVQHGPRTLFCPRLTALPSKKTKYPHNCTVPTVRSTLYGPHTPSSLVRTKQR